jgi:hypothetical protein
VTTIALALMAVLVEMACSLLTIDVSNLINFGSPCLNSSNAWDFSLNIARIESRDSHLLSILASSVTHDYGDLGQCIWCTLPRPTSKRASKLDGVEVLFRAEDMVL